MAAQQTLASVENAVDQPGGKAPHQYGRQYDNEDGCCCIQNFREASQSFQHIAGQKFADHFQVFSSILSKKEADVEVFHQKGVVDCGG